MGIFPRKIEGVLGLKVLNLANRKFLKDSQLEKREVYLPETGLTMHYYERTGNSTDETNDDNRQPPPTLLLFHGITDEAKNMAAFVRVLRKEFPHWRIIVPDMIGHGHDLARAQKEGRDFQYPTPSCLLRSITEFVSVLQIQKCFAFGMSMGGALAYFLQQQKPELVESAILISPALDAVLDPQFIDDFETRQKNHFCYESRDDVKYFFRDLSCKEENRKKKNPIPKFFLEAIWQDRQARVPQGHFHTFFKKLLDARGKDQDWLGCSTDIAPDAKRLVIWPEHDYIANHEQGKAFFANSSPSTTTFHSVPDCGHLFHSNGKIITELVTPMMVEYLKQQQGQ